MRTPRVSVLLPVRDAAATLGECLASLACQTLAEFEVLAVDDGSRDGSRAILEAHARKDPRFKVASTPARGLVAALNTALASARAPLVARMDADDRSHPERLALQAARLDAEPALSILGSRVELVSDATRPNRGMRAYVAWLNSLIDHAAIVRDLYVESPLVHPSVTMRTDALRQLGGWRDFDGPEDYDLWLRAHQRGLVFAKLERVLLSWRDHARRLTRCDPRYASERFQRLKLDALLAGVLRGGRSVVVWGAGPIGKAWAKDLVARGVEVVAFAEVAPKKIGQRIGGVVVLGVDAAAARRGPLHLAAVGQSGARDRIRAEAARLGLVDGKDLVAVA